MVVAVPVGLGSAIYLSEYARPRVRQRPQAHPRGAGRHPERGPRLLRLLGDRAVDRAALHQRRPLQPRCRRASRSGSCRSRSSRRCRRTPSAPCRWRSARRATAWAPRRSPPSPRSWCPAAVSGLVAAFILAVSRAIGETMVVFIAAGAAGNQPFELEPARAGPHHDGGHGHAGPGHRPGEGRGAHVPEPLLRRARCCS